ncbi:Fimbria adhesin protein [Paraburkholderia aspalathi]|uniref:Fimbria adhesin protein n=2 Tax=Paraburkholderia aspalathi TaxID=1324617 RepID=A0ABM8T438_9BURK|nr:fimbrial protein [Paraburkholderia aspalathi]MBK3823796.1 fimbrial protein [Paraburkholderia aspalathi]MBK3835644.1 fimbrial protein [Paraburkholderia aspalathi]MBK3865395.1 fimbrial protein [Paraburkholderia aspalathi]CAE6853963.1 Fimbria adhesin protein [Paraburkholderia aspalathi]
MILQRLLLLLATLMVSTDAAAACTGTPGVVNISLPTSRSVARDAPGISIIWDSGPQSGTTPNLTCTPDSTTLAYGYQQSMTLAREVDFYATPMTGVAIKVFASWGGASSNGPSMIWPRGTRTVSQPANGYPAYYRIVLIKNGPIRPGSFTLPIFLASTVLGQSSMTELRLTQPTMNITANGCTVNNNPIGVPLPTIRSGQLGATGATAETAPFNIALTCDSGIQVAYQLDGTSPAGMAASTGVLANRTNTGDATGVGVQVLQGTSGSSTPVTFGTRSATFVTTTSADQAVSIPFIARYYRTSSTLTPGAVWARATFTMNYQ